MHNRAAFPQMTDAQYAMHIELIERANERNSGVKTHLLSRFFDLRRLHFPANIGTFAWSSRAIKTRWLSLPNSINYGGGHVTPGDMARDYLATKYGNRRIRCTSEQWEQSVAQRKSAALYVEPQRIENAAYLDISGAYWQIVRAVGWDVNYLSGKYLNSNSRMIDFPYAHHKMARNCLVSVGLPGAMKLWTGKELVFKKSGSRFINLILWRLVQDVLHGIAADMVAIGAVYVNTDGYILPERALDAGMDVLETWGIDGKVKHSGSADIVGIGTYCFISPTEGTYQTKNYQHGRRRYKRALNKITPDNNDWLRTRFGKLGKFAQYEWEWFEK